MPEASVGAVTTRWSIALESMSETSHQSLTETTPIQRRENCPSSALQSPRIRPFTSVSVRAQRTPDQRNSTPVQPPWRLPDFLTTIPSGGLPSMPVANHPTLEPSNQPPNRNQNQLPNNCHWQLDVLFNEDASRVRERTLANNLSWLRRVAVSLLKHHPSKDSIKGKQPRASWNHHFLAEVLCFH